MIKVTHKGKEILLTAKEKRLFDVYQECQKTGMNITIGAVCDICHTTPRTLLGKTESSLIKKLGSEEVK